MARHLFLGGMPDWGTDLGADETSTSGQPGMRALLIPGGTITFWNAASGGSRYTDLLDGVGTPITQVVADATGQFPQIQGPDQSPNIWYMWADGNAGAGPRRIVVATDLGDAVNGLSATATNLANDINDISTRVANSLGVVRYDTSTASWPTRPDADSRAFAWIGPTAPPIGSGHMLDGDLWINTQP